MAFEGGSVLINQSIHTLDLLTYLIGDPCACDAMMTNHTLKGVIETEDTLEAYVEFKNGARASFYATNAYISNAPVLIDLVCEKKSYRLEGPDLYVQEGDGAYEKIQLSAKVALGKGYWGTGHPSAISNFYDSLTDEAEFLVRLDEVDRTMRLMFAIYDSARSK